MATAIGRNDPCRCGSGRKYKACCMPGDQVAARGGMMPSDDELRQAREAERAAARSGEAWQVDVVPAAVRVSGGAATSLVMVAAGAYVLHGEPLPSRPGTAAARARAMADGLAAAARRAGVQPVRVRIRDAREVEALAALLNGRGIAVEAGPVVELDHALDGALEHLTGNVVGATMTMPETWAELACTPAELADFHAAAAEFYRAAPWEEFGDQDVVRIRFPEGEEWAASILGGGGFEFGFALYADPADLDRMLEFEDEPRPGEMLDAIRDHTLSLTFDGPAELPRPMQREVARAGWELASPRAYPRVYGVKVPERRITAEHVRRVTGVARAVALVSQGQDPQPATGLQVAVVPGNAGPWPLPDTASPVLPQGPGAQPEAALEEWRYEPGRVDALEEERFARFQAWLERQTVPKGLRAAAIRNGRCWADFLGYLRLPASAASEYDLRVFLYGFYPLAADTTAAAARELPRSLGLLAQFMEAEEGIRYPFAAAVQEELEAIARAAADHDVALRDALLDTARLLAEYLDVRLLTFDRELPESTTGFWPVFPVKDPRIERLAEELQRRWLLWHDEEVRAGNTAFEELWPALEKRQRAWEDAPHPALGGGSPRDAIDEYELRDPDEDDDDGDDESDVDLEDLPF